MIPAVLLVVVSYCAGAIPFGLMIARGMGLGDVRKIGSGNIGATNVLRTGSKTAAALTLLLDALKGAAAVLVARALLGEAAALVAGLSAFVGHLFPIWLRFKGGKGVATFLGVMLAVSFPAGLATCAVWLGTAFALRYSSLAALIGSATAPLWLALLGRADVVWLGVAMAVLVWLKHLPNIRRLRAGTEPRIGKSR